jgi:hypothetical protein
VVLDVVDQYTSVIVAPLSNAVHLAPPTGLVLPRSVSGLPYECMVLCELQPSVAHSQLGRVIAALPLSLLDIIEQVGELEWQPKSWPAGVHVGPPMVDLDDPRWYLVSDEVADAEALTVDEEEVQAPVSVRYKEYSLAAAATDSDDTTTESRVSVELDIIGREGRHAEIRVVAGRRTGGVTIQLVRAGDQPAHGLWTTDGRQVPEDDALELPPPESPQVLVSYLRERLLL